MHLFHSIYIMHWLLEHEKCPEFNLNYRRGANYASNNNINFPLNNQNNDNISNLLERIRNNLRNLHLIDDDDFNNFDRLNVRYHFNRTGNRRGRGNWIRRGNWSDRGNWRGRGNINGRGRENINGRGRGNINGRGRGNFYGRSRGNFYGRSRGIFNGRGRGRINARGNRYINGNRYQNRGRSRRLYQRGNHRGGFLNNSSENSEDFGGSVFSGESYENESFEGYNNSFDEYYSNDED